MYIFYGFFFSERYFQAKVDWVFNVYKISEWVAKLFELYKNRKHSVEKFYLEINKLYSYDSDKQKI